jgi:hypothetical protein
MDPTASIRKLGFQRWYERQLIDCHLALVTCFLAGITIAACMESVMSGNFFSTMLVMVGAGLVAWYSWRRYITVLTRAEFYGERSICPSCQAYGRFDILASGTDLEPGRIADAVAPLGAAWLRVQCRKCGTAWRMPE